jgi:hypothetical protein
MNVFGSCFLGRHAWEGCKCSKCGATRDEGHDWRGGNCRRCGKTASTDESARAAVADQILLQLVAAMDDAPLNPEPCRQFLMARLVQDRNPQSVVDAFVKALAAEPAKYLDTAILASRNAEKIWEQLVSGLGAQAYRLSSTACKAKLLTELKAGHTAQVAVDSLFAAIKQDPQSYVSFPSCYSSCYRESTDKGAIGHDRRNVRTLSAREWEHRVSAAFAAVGTSGGKAVANAQPALEEVAA